MTLLFTEKGEMLIIDWIVNRIFFVKKGYERLKLWVVCTFFKMLKHG